MNTSHFRVIAGLALSCAVVFLACTLEPTVDPPSEIALPQPEGMPAGIRMTQLAANKVGSHMEVAVAVSGALKEGESPLFTSKIAVLDLDSPPSNIKPQSIEALLVSRKSLFEAVESAEGETGTKFRLKDELYGIEALGAPKTIFAVVQLDLNEIQKQLKIKLPKSGTPEKWPSIWWVEENPAAFGGSGSGKLYTNKDSGWLVVGTRDESSFNTDDGTHSPIAGLTVDNGEEIFRSVSVIVVAESIVKISFFNVVPYPDGLTGTSSFEIKSSAGDTAMALEPIFVYTIDAGNLTVAPPPLPES
jgi:hypothetical protein